MKQEILSVLRYFSKLGNIKHPQEVCSSSQWREEGPSQTILNCYLGFNWAMVRLWTCPLLTHFMHKVMLEQVASLSFTN